MTIHDFHALVLPLQALRPSASRAARPHLLMQGVSVEIPEDIVMNRVLHNKPIHGDSGIQWEPDEDAVDLGITMDEARANTGTFGGE